MKVALRYRFSATFNLMNQQIFPGLFYITASAIMQNFRDNEKNN